MKLSIIVPCFNEEENINLFEKELFPFIKKYDYELIFVDDGSKDSTYKELLKIKNKQVRVCKHKQNKGMGAAIKTGIKAAKGELIITLDSDLTFHPRYIKNLIKKYEQTNADCVIGSHVLGVLSKKIPFHRSLLTKFSNRVYSLLLGKNVTAITPIFRLYKKESIKSMNIESNDFNINAEILFKLIQAKKQVVEVPVTLGIRKHGQSKMNIKKEIKNHLKLITKILFWRLKTYF